MKIIKDDNIIKVYNDGIEIISAKSEVVLRSMCKMLLQNNSDIFEIEILNRILYYLDSNCSTKEVA